MEYEAAPVAVTDGVGAVVDGVLLSGLYQLAVPVTPDAVSALADRFWQSDRFVTPGVAGVGLTVTLIAVRGLSQSPTV